MLCDYIAPSQYSWPSAPGEVHIYIYMGVCIQHIICVHACKCHPNTLYSKRGLCPRSTRDIWTIASLRHFTCILFSIVLTVILMILLFNFTILFTLFNTIYIPYLCRRHSSWRYVHQWEWCRNGCQQWTSQWVHSDIAAMYYKVRTGWNVVSLGIFIYFVGGISESGECRVNMSNGSIRKFSLTVGLCYEMPFRSQLHLQFWSAVWLSTY